ncbi:regulatory protein [Euzebya pacifica]|uniref:Regulatory protein n=1 Tax=Euzebya pacifica TaxID=1608957 RepID=A0A346XVM8_9ACTN|nr:helix-turn-helix domain-containing protein [Euzebya pacifica]AXV06275.1 regulatory protein [Euzebya pacifica]
MSRTFDPLRFDDTALSAEPVAVATRPASRVAAELLHDVDELTESVVRTIQTRLGSYTGRAVPRDDLWWSVRATTGMLVRVLAEDREPTQQEIQTRRALGERRAMQALPVDQLVEAMQVAFGEVWSALSDRAMQQGHETVTDLLSLSRHFWTMMHTVSSVVTEAHHDVAREQVARTRRRSAGFLDILAGLPATETQARHEAAALGLDPDATFVAAVRPPREGDDPLRSCRDGVVMVERPDRVLLLTVATADGAFPLDLVDDPVGIGMARPGLSGAKETVRDAELAHAAASALGRSRLAYADDWFACVSSGELSRVEPLVRDAVAALRADPQMAHTVDAYIRADGKLVAAGEAIDVHANTVAYRLDRFVERAGLDPRTSDGLMRCRLALLIAEASPSRGGGAAEPTPTD